MCIWHVQVAFELLSSRYGREVNVWSPATEVGAVAWLVPPALLGCAALSTPTSRTLFWPFVEPPVDLLCFGAADSRSTPAPAATAAHASSAC